MLRPGVMADFADLLTVINAAAQRYHGAIPADCWREPYMTPDALAAELGAGVRFTLCEEAGTVLGVMGLQNVRDVALVRHAYTLPAAQGRGVGSALLAALRAETTEPVLIGTWAAATWAIGFYERRGFRVVNEATKDTLLERYWRVPARQRAASVVLADAAWVARGGPV